MEAIFKACSIIPIRNLQNLLRYQGIWVEKDKQVTIARSLYNTLYKKDQTEWTKEQILDYIRTNRLFAYFKLNRISGLIPDLFNQIRPIDLRGFGINLIGQSTPSTQVTDRNTPVNQNTDQITPVVQVTDPQAIYP